MKAAAIGSVFLLSACGSSPAKSLEGDACPQVSAEAFHARGMKLRGLEYEHIVVRRAFGRAYCKAVGTAGGGGADGEVTCRLTAPFLIHTTAGGVDRYYDLGAGRPAIVGLRNGEAQCVLDPSGWTSKMGTPPS